MASKFMAFENVASTSFASLENEDGEHERIEMNATQYPNYQSNQNHGNDPNPFGAVDPDDDLNENFEEKPDDNVGYRKFIYNNSEQFKSVVGGLLLLMGSGVHIVWGIFRVFLLYNCNEEKSFYLRLVIWSWYLGAIIGSACAGYAVGKYRKGRIYFAGGSLLIVSGIFLMLAGDTDILLLISRTIGGFTQGLTYVVVIVHASDNATKEFREFLMLIVGAVFNYSILLSVLAFFHTEGLFRSGLLNGVGLVAFGIITVLITTKHATETVPFILQTNGSELDALQTMGKLKKKPVSARSVHHDFLVLKNLVQDEMEHYGTPDFKKVLLPENRKSFIFCLYGRLCSVLSFNLPLIVMVMLFLRHWADGSFESQGYPTKQHCQIKHNTLVDGGNLAASLKTNENINDEMEIKAPLERVVREKRHTDNLETNIEKPKSLETEAGEGRENESSQNTKSQTEREKSEENKKHAKHDEDETKKKENKESEKDEEKNGKNKIDENKPKHHANEENAHEQHHGKSTKPQKDDLKQSKMEKDEEATSKAKEEKLLKEKEHGREHERERERQPKKAENAPHKHTDKEKNSKVNEYGRKDDAELNGKKSEESEQHETEKSNLNVETVAAPTFFGHLIIFLHSRELTLILLAWFIFGTITAAVLYTFNLKRFIYYISCVLSSVLALTGIAHSFHLLSGILHFCLIVYFNYVTIPIDVFSHCMLAEAFPVTLKPFSVASVAIIEHLVHIIIITLYLSDWFHNSILLFMCIVAFISHEIARNLPQKGDLPLAEAREQYQNIDLMLFNEPKTGYNQQQEFI